MERKWSATCALFITLLFLPGAALATIVAAGPFANPAQWPAAAKVNTFYGNPDVVLSFGVAQENDFTHVENTDDFNNNKGHPFSAIAQESVFTVVGTLPGQWKILFMLEHEAGFSQGNEGGGSGEIGLERAWVEYKLPWFKTWWINVGNAIDAPQLFHTVLLGDNYGVRVFGDLAKNLSWRFGYLKIEENLDAGGIGVGVAGTFGPDATTGPLAVAGPTGVANAGSGIGGDNDQDLWYGYLDWRPGKQHLRPYFLFNRDFSESCTPGAIGRGCTAPGSPVNEKQLEQVYIGLDGNFKVGPLKIDASGIYMGGNLEKAGGFDGDLNAFHFYADVQWPIGKWTPHLGGFFSSGDDDPTDDDLEGFGEANNLAIVNQDIWGGEHRLIGEAGEPRGLGFFAESTFTTKFVGPSARCPAGSPRGFNGQAICKGPKFGAVFNQPGGAVNRDGLGLQNPGVWGINLGLDYQATKRLFLNTNLTYFSFAEAEDHFRKSLGIRANRLTAAPSPSANFDDEIGFEWNIGGTFRQSRNFFIDGSFATLIPTNSGVVKQLYGEDDLAWSVFLETHWRF